MSDVAPFARLLRIVWLAVCAGGVLILVVMGGLAATTIEPTLSDARDGVFYGVALLAMAATAGAFALIRTMENRLFQAGSEAEAQQTVRSFGIAALAMAELPAILGAVGALLTGELLTLAFGATLLAFAWLTWPSDDRVAAWLALRQHG